MAPMRDPRDELEEHRSDAPRGLFFSRRGNWFHDGDRIFHDGLRGLLDRSVVRDADDRLIVTTGRDAVEFASEDAPVLVRSISPSSDGLQVALSTGVVEALGDLAIGTDNRLRTPVLAGRLWAVLSRSAAQVLEPMLIVDDAGRAVVVDGDRRHKVVPLDTDWRQLPALSRHTATP